MPRSARMPKGTVTFMFTDIEGSTRMWEQHPRAMQAALARHDTLLREAIEAHGGYIFKTMGDAFCAAFPTASEALDAALDAQRAVRLEQRGSGADQGAHGAAHGCGRSPRPGLLWPASQPGVPAPLRRP
ncbi:MAG: adenylate/guanylate cyclase domain-containing protein [Chloroflexia bacterium]